MTKPRLKLLTLAVGAAVVATVSGCDLQENANLANGRDKFVEQCGVCHSLAEAGTTATIGPDLDAAFADARSRGFDQDTIEGIVEYQIQNPRETDPDDPTFMPADLVDGDDLRDVAAYVGSVAGVPGAAPPQGGGDDPGAQAFLNNGCGSCHILDALDTTGAVGPKLDQVLPGQSPEMIRESIVDPEALISAGFPAGIMPANYGKAISDEDLDALSEYLAETAGGALDDRSDELPGSQTGAGSASRRGAGAGRPSG